MGASSTTFADLDFEHFGTKLFSKISEQNNGTKIAEEIMRVFTIVDQDKHLNLQIARLPYKSNDYNIKLVFTIIFILFFFQLTKF